MLSIYEDYRSEPLSLTLEKMASLHQEMAKEIGRDEDAMNLYHELLAAAVKYSGYRSHWSLWDREKKLAEDAARTSCHNLVIIAVNTLARYLKLQGNPAAWRDVLGDEKENPACRKRIGDFACYLIFMESLNAR